MSLCPSAEREYTCPQQGAIANLLGLDQESLGLLELLVSCFLVQLLCPRSDLPQAAVLIVQLEGFQMLHFDVSHL